MSETFIDKWRNRILGAWWVLTGRWIALPPEVLERDLWVMRNLR